jgi:thiol-disulfide isomerase/thioredoxin
VAQTSQPVAASGAASAVKLSVPDFTVNTPSFLGGQRFTLSQHADKPTLLYFMASWCITCVPEARAIAQLQKGELGQQVNFVVLDIDPSDTDHGLESFWKAANSPNNIWALDKGSKVTAAYGVKSLDTTVVIAGGQETSRTVGGQSTSQLMAVLSKALGNGS